MIRKVPLAVQVLLGSAAVGALSWILEGIVVGAFVFALLATLNLVFLYGRRWYERRPRKMPYQAVLVLALLALFAVDASRSGLGDAAAKDWFFFAVLTIGLLVGYVFRRRSQ